MGTGNQGMSSEELDKLTTEEAEETPPVEEESPPAEKPDEETLPKEKPDDEIPPKDKDLAKEALEATEEPEVDPKDAVIGDFRRKLRASELQTAQLQGRMEAQQAKPPEPSPLELAAKEQECSVDDVDINGKLYKAQQAWEKNQAGNQARQQQLDDYQAGSEAAALAMTDENLGEGLGVETLAKIGEHLLTVQDQEEIFLAGKKCGTVLYKKLKERIIEAGGTVAQELQKRLKPTQAKPKKGDGDVKPKPPPKPQEEGDEPEVRASTSAIMSELEMF